MRSQRKHCWAGDPHGALRETGKIGYVSLRCRLCPFEVVHASDVLDDAVAGVVPDVHAEGEVGLGFHGQVRLDSSWPAAIYSPMLLRRVAFPDFCEPCLPSPAEKPPAGAGWLHEIKHDGFRMLVRRDAAGVRLFTHNGHDWTGRFPLIARAARA
jgi:hypothetical protein